MKLPASLTLHNIGLAAMLVLLLLVRADIKANRREIIENRALIARLTGRNEKLILDFMSRTVDRWDELQRNNPTLDVPRVVEPVEKPHLRESEMTR